MKSKMKFKHLDRQYEEIKDQIHQAITDVLESVQYIQGESVKKLEKELADYTGSKYCITCANGTDALTLCLLSIGINNQDVVFVPDLTFVASAEAIVQAGGIPVFVDVDLETWTISPEDLKNKIKIINDETDLIPKAVISVDLFGNPSDYDQIKQICKDHNLKLIVDGAQSFGSEYRGVSTLKIGDFSTTSFFPAKNLSCYGDGGAIFTDDPEYANTVRSLCFHGKSLTESGIYERVGMNSRLDEIQAAILRVKLKHFEEFEKNQIQKNAELIRNLIQENSDKAHNNMNLSVQKILKESNPVMSQFSILFDSEEQRDWVKNKMEEEGIPAQIYYLFPLLMQQAYSEYDLNLLRLKSEQMNRNSRSISNRILSIPFDAYLSNSEINQIIQVVFQIRLCLSESRNK